MPGPSVTFRQPSSLAVFLVDSSFCLLVLASYPDCLLPTPYSFEVKETYISIYVRPIKYWFPNFLIGSIFLCLKVIDSNLFKSPFFRVLWSHLGAAGVLAL